MPRRRQSSTRQGRRATTSTVSPGRTATSPRFAVRDKIGFDLVEDTRSFEVLVVDSAEKLSLGK
jgi:hypothetical protein